MSSYVGYIIHSKSFLFKITPRYLIEKWGTILLLLYFYFRINWISSFCCFKYDDCLLRWAFQLLMGCSAFADFSCHLPCRLYPPLLMRAPLILLENRHVSYWSFKQLLVGSIDTKILSNTLPISAGKQLSSNSSFSNFEWGYHGFPLDFLEVSSKTSKRCCQLCRRASFYTRGFTFQAAPDDFY